VLQFDANANVVAIYSRKKKKLIGGGGGGGGAGGGGGWGVVFCFL